MFEVVSGRPAGEVYHREVVVTATRKLAERVVSLWNRAIGDDPNWLWGPHIRGLDEGRDHWPVVWDGHQEVPAQIVTYRSMRDYMPLP